MFRWTTGSAKFNVGGMYRVQQFEVRDINTLAAVIDNYP